MSRKQMAIMSSFIQSFLFLLFKICSWTYVECVQNPAWEVIEFMMVLTAYLLALIFIWTGKAAKFLVPPCDLHMFESNVDNCLSDFNKSMETSGYQDRCPWPAVKGIYNKVKLCVDNWANVSWCKGHRSLADKVFLDVHHTYFSLCGQVHDPPLTTLIMLIAPVIIATLFLPLLCVNLTTWNTDMPSTSGP